MNIVESYDAITRYAGKWEQYYAIYQEWFEKFQGTHCNILEIGIFHGGSMEAWHNFFGSGSMIYGVDNNPKVTEMGDQYKIIVGDQGNAEFWDTIDLPELDVIIDDGSHFSNHQILTFEKMFPRLKEGGIYMIEDTHCSYMEHYGQNIHSQSSFIEYCKRIVDYLHVDYLQDPINEPTWARSVNSIHFYDSVVVIEKGLRRKYSPTYHNRELS